MYAIEGSLEEVEVELVVEVGLEEVAVTTTEDPEATARPARPKIDKKRILKGLKRQSEQKGRQSEPHQ